MWWAAFQSRRDRIAYGRLSKKWQERVLKTTGREVLALLCAQDPDLTLESIAERVRRMNAILVEAWCNGDMRPARPFVSDGVFNRFRAQLALMRGEDRRNLMDEVSVIDVDLEGAEIAAPLDVVHVRMTARARDVEVSVAASKEDEARALHRAPLETYREIWSLARRHGATTRREGQCCGAHVSFLRCRVVRCPAGASPKPGGDDQVPLLRRARLLSRARLGTG
jgi:hypothetical protein